MRDRFEAVISALRALQDQVGAVEKDRQDAYTKLRLEREAFTTDRNRVECDLADAESRADMHEKRTASLQQQLDAANAEVEELRRRPVELRALKRQVRSLETDLVASNRENARYQAQSEAQSVEISRLNAEIASVRAEMASSETDKARLAARRAVRAEEHADALSRRVSELVAQLEQAHARIDRAERAMRDHAART